MVYMVAINFKLALLKKNVSIDFLVFVFHPMVENPRDKYYYVSGFLSVPYCSTLSSVRFFSLRWCRNLFISSNSLRHVQTPV